MRGNRSRKRILVRRAACQDENRDNCIFHGKHRKRSIDFLDTTNLRIASICRLLYPTRLRILASRNKRIIKSFVYFSKNSSVRSRYELSASIVGVGNRRNSACVVTRS